MSATLFITAPNRLRRRTLIPRIAILLLLFLAPLSSVAQVERPSSGDIVILYENDVHGAIEGYPLLAALRDQMRSITPYVSIVSSGDFLSGCPIGAISNGRYPVRMMNAVGYDYVVPGNHEFDFGIDTLIGRLSELSATVLCANLTRTPDQTSLFPCSAIQRYGDVTVAYIGVTTPTTITTSTPRFFQDSLHNWVYTFYPSNLDSILQHCVNEVRTQGADYVVLLAHIGDNDLPPLIAATTGIDVVLDGHFHSVIPRRLLRNRNGDEVLWTSTGTKFQNIGMLVIPRKGPIWNQLLPTAAMQQPTSSVQDTMLLIKQAFTDFGKRLVGFSQASVERTPTSEDCLDVPLGNLFCDAFCAMSGAYIAFSNNGSLRDDLPQGTLTHGDIYSAAPFDNQLCVVEVTGRTLIDALEMGCRRYPSSEGEFPQVAGLIFEIDTTIPSSVVLDDNGLFLRVDGSRRVKHVRVWDPEKKYYLPIEADKRYRVAGCDYTLIGNGDGYNFYGLKMINRSVCDYLRAIERYITDTLGGTIDSYYATSHGRIRIATAE